MLHQSINQGAWRGGAKLQLTNEDQAQGSAESDFWNLVRRGRVPWMCKDCLKNKKKGLCECVQTESDKAER